MRDTVTLEKMQVGDIFYHSELEAICMQWNDGYVNISSMVLDNIELAQLGSSIIGYPTGRRGVRIKLGNIVEFGDQLLKEYTK